MITCLLVNRIIDSDNRFVPKQPMIYALGNYFLIENDSSTENISWINELTFPSSAF